MWRKLSVFLAVCAMSALPAAQAVAQQTDQRGYGPWWSDGYGWPFWWMCPLMMMVMIAVIAMIVLARRRAGGGWSPPWQGSSHAALQILSERFARGEIQKDEYQEKRAAILSGR